MLLNILNFTNSHFLIWASERLMSLEPMYTHTNARSPYTFRPCWTNQPVPPKRPQQFRYMLYVDTKEKNLVMARRKGRQNKHGRSQIVDDNKCIQWNHARTHARTHAQTRTCKTIYFAILLSCIRKDLATGLSHVIDYLCGVAVRVPGYKSRGPGSIPRAEK
jgi:hypothetical protein